METAESPTITQINEQDLNKVSLETGYGILTNSEQRKILKERVIELAKQAKDAGMVVFMDKSARPIAHLLRRVFPILNPDTQPPDIRFLNIGTEKIFPLVRWGEQHGIKPPMTVEQVLTSGSVTDIYGKENTDNLKKLLKGNTTETDSQKKRIIVDDVKHSGRSLRIALKVSSLVDTAHTYEGFSFIESDEQKKPFMGKEGLPFMPWRGITGVEDPTQEERDPFSQFGYEDKRSFSSIRTTKPEAMQKSFMLRRDLDLLAGEIKSEH